MEGQDIVKYEGKYFKYSRTKYIPIKTPDLSILSARELNTINEVLERLGHVNATQISDYSHGDVPWMTTEKNKITLTTKRFFIELRLTRFAHMERMTLFKTIEKLSEFQKYLKRLLRKFRTLEEDLEVFYQDPAHRLRCQVLQCN